MEGARELSMILPRARETEKVRGHETERQTNTQVVRQDCLHLFPPWCAGDISFSRRNACSCMLQQTSLMRNMTRRKLPRVQDSQSKPFLGEGMNFNGGNGTGATRQQSPRV